MLTLFFFSRTIMGAFNDLQFILVYLGAILGGNLLTLWMYRRDMTYTAIGASGGVSGVVFATVALFPNMKMIILPIPIPIYGWIYAILYLAYSVYSMKNSIGNIGHAAHLGGAVIGILSAIICYPSILFAHGQILAIMVLPLAFLGYLAYKEK